MEVHNYPNYLIYPDGRVWSKCGKGRFLKHINDSNGYKYVNIKRPYRIHRLIAEHYIPNPNNFPYVDHIDRVRTNNNINNLRWVTPIVNTNNSGVSKNNKCGHKYISYNVRDKRWLFQKQSNINKDFNNRRYKTLTEALCYKFIYILISKYK